MESSRSDTYLTTMKQLAAKLGIHEAAIDFSLALASGGGDLLVVLLEPLEYFHATSLESGVRASHTLREVDRLLRESSDNQRDIYNTCVLDVRLFFSAQRRQKTDINQLKAKEAQSHAAFERIVFEMRPKVIISCQCGTSNAASKFVRNLSSKLPPPSDRTYVAMHGQRTPIYRAFHPSTYKEGHIQRWAGTDILKQDECAHVLQKLLGLIFLKAIRSPFKGDVVEPLETKLRETIKSLQTDRPASSQDTQLAYRVAGNPRQTVFKR